eukprot:m.115833 g.115833  ORF g.115833 m.115833 type:complete len:242 (+) comp37567_c0_seq3:37-762(+)
MSPLSSLFPRIFLVTVLAILQGQRLAADHDDNEHHSCPPIPQNVAGHCAEMCSESGNDRCTGSKICCSNGCGKDCLEPACLYNGTLRSYGSSFLGLDGCNNCTCNGGTIECTMKECSDKGCLTTNGTLVLKDGEWQKQKCTPCHCDLLYNSLYNSTKFGFVCAVHSCLDPNCVFFQDYVHNNDGCCPHCELSTGKTVGFAVGIVLGIAIIVIVVILIVKRDTVCKKTSRQKDEIPFQKAKI